MRPLTQTGAAVRTTVKSRLPERWVHGLRTSFDRVYCTPPASLVPVEAVYPELEKRRRVAPATVPTPEAASMRFVPHPNALKIQGSTYTVPEDYDAVLTDVTYCPKNNVLVTDNKRVVYETYSDGPLDNLFIRDLYRRGRGRIEGHSALLRSRYNEHYHAVVDNVPRLFALQEPEYRALPEIKLLAPGGLTGVERFFLDRLGLDNVREVSPEPGRLYELERLIFTPFKTTRWAGYLPARYVEKIRALVFPSRPSRREHRLLVSRRSSDRPRQIENLAAVEAEARRRGFETVRLEELSFEEQVELFYDAEAVVGAHGAGLVNALFAPPGLRVVELFPIPYVVPHYYYLNTSLGHRYAYLLGQGEAKDARFFDVDVSAFGALLDREGLR